jgi:hypothetical protein
MQCVIIAASALGRRRDKRLVASEAAYGVFAKADSLAHHS